MRGQGIKDVSSASRQVATKSAMNPILWTAAITTPAAIGASAMVTPPLNYLFFVLSIVPIVVACWGFVYFAKNNANRLQSEEHVEQMEMLSRIGSNLKNEEIIISSNSDATTNKSLPYPTREKGGL